MKLHLYNHPSEVKNAKIIKVGNTETIHINNEFYGIITSRENGILATKTSGIVDDLPDTILFTLKRVEKTDLIKKLESETGVTLEEIRESGKTKCVKHKLFQALYVTLSNEPIAVKDETLGRLTRGQAQNSILINVVPKFKKDAEFKRIVKLLSKK